MELKFLKAGNGDSILVQHKSHNIIIDGGNNSKYLISEIETIKEKGELIDLLVITHQDDDHIKGIIDLLNHIIENGYNEDTPFVKRVIFNSPRKILGELPIPPTNELSFKQAYDVEELLMKMELEWETYTSSNNSLTFEDLQVNIFAPSEIILEKYSSNTEVCLTGDNKCDWESPMKILDKYIDDKSLDNAEANQNSIVIELKTSRKKVLLTADITPDRLEEIVAELRIKNSGNPVVYDVVKLPHHGSYRNLTKPIVEGILCNTFIITTNSKRHYLPNKRALLKVLKYSDRREKEIINFIFNYEEALENLQITNKEMRDYNFNLTGNNKAYGISI